MDFSKVLGKDNLVQEVFIKGSFKIIKCMDLVLINILMVIFMKDFGKIIHRKEMENTTFLEKITTFIKEILKTENSLDLVII